MENVKLRLKGGRFEAKVPYANGRGVELVREIDGRRFDRESKIWSFPLNWETAKSLRKVAKGLGVELEMSEKVKQWGREEKVRQAGLKAQREALKNSHQELVDLPVVREEHPEMWSALKSRPFQTQGVKFMDERSGVLLADDPGLGKTLQTLATFVESRVTGPILIIANKSAAEITWPNEIKKWLPEDEVLRYGSHIPSRDRSRFWDKVWSVDDRRVWVIMNPHWVRAKAQVDQYGKFRYIDGRKIVSATTPQVFDGRWAGVVADESHETLACSTGNAKKWSQQRQGLGLLEVSGPKISISGTPMRGKPENLFGQLQWLDPSKYSSYWNWAKKHFSVSGEGYGGAMVVDTSSMDTEAFYEEAADLMIRRDKSTVASDLPPKQYAGTTLPGGDVHGIWLPMLKEQDKMYKEFVKNSSLVDEDGNQLDALGALALYTRMKQLATTTGRVGTREIKMPKLDENGAHERDVDGRKLYELDEDGDPLMIPEQYLIPEFPSNKFEWLVEWLSERDLIGRDAKGKGKVIIASQFRQVIDLFRDELSRRETESFAITGAVSAEERVRQQNEFQQNPDSPKIFFLQSKAGGTSLTLDMADDVIILDEMWDPDVQTQIEDRAHRLSRKHNVSIWYTRSLDSIEEYIGATVEERNRTCRGIMDGSRGVETRKKLIPEVKK